uniref:Uncharacterized protein n=1 Tax=Anopheles atroparvus TaxID=41427 RepID=A0A182J0L6_ANOAO
MEHLPSRLTASTSVSSACTSTCEKSSEMITRERASPANLCSPAITPSAPGSASGSTTERFGRRSVPATGSSGSFRIISTPVQAEPAGFLRRSRREQVAVKENDTAGK